MVAPEFDLKSIYQTVLKSLFTVFLLLCSMGVSGQTNIFTYSNSNATIPTGFVLTNNVSTNAIDLGTYLLVDAGAPSDYIVTPSYDLSAYPSVTINVNVATFGSGTAYPLKIEFSTNGGTSWNATTYTTATPSSSTYITGGPITITQTFTATTKFRFSNNGNSGRGVRIQTLKLDANAPAAITSNAVIGNWSSPSSWVGGVVPTSSDNAIIVSGAVIEMDNTTFNTRNAGTTTIVNSCGTLATKVQYINKGTTTVNGTFQLNAGGYSNTDNNFVYGAAGTLIFNNTSSFGVNNTDQFWPTASGPFNVTILQGGMTLNSGANRTVAGTFQTAAGVTLSSATLTLNGTAQINAGGFFNDTPTYGSASTLVYNTTFGLDKEWTSNGAAGVGIPANVTVQAGTLNLPNVSRGIPGNISINTGATLNLNNVSGDLYIGGNWTDGGNFNPNGRAVFFNGAANQTITKTGGETFNYLINNKSGGSLILANNVIINGTSGDVLQLLNAGLLDLYGQTLTLNGTNGNISVNAAGRTITSGVGGVLAIAGNKFVTGSGTLVTAANVTVLATAGIDFGSSKTTVNGTFQINSGGFANNNAPIYGSSSTLVYNGVTGYGAGNEWTGNATSAGQGTPQNVTLTNSSVNMPSTARALAGNLTIGTGSALNLNGTFGSDLNIGGNWTNNKTFNANNRAVFFNGASAQTLTGATTFDYLIMNNSGGLTLNNSISINNGLTLTTGSITLGANNITSPSTVAITGSSALSHIIAISTGRMIRTGVTNTNQLFPLGYSATKYSPITLNNTTGTSDLSVNLSNTFTGAVSDPTKVVNLQWNVTSSAGTTATVSPTWEVGDQGSMVNPATGELGNYQGTAYVLYPTILSQYTTTATAVSLVSGANPIVVGNTGAVYTNAAAYFKSNVTTGTWATPASWQYSTDKVTWSTSTVVPTSSALAITIQNGHTITVGASATAKNLTIDATGVLTVNSSFNISGTNTVKGTWNQTTTSVLTNSGTLTFNSNSIYNNNVNNGTIPIATWNSASNCNIIGYTNSSPVNAVLGLNQTFGNLTFNNAGSSSFINLFSTTSTINVAGILTVGPSINNQVSFSNSAGTITANINKLNITGGFVNGVGASATVNLIVANDMSLSGSGIFRNSTGSGSAIVTVNNDLIITDNGLLQIVAGSNANVPSQTLNVGRDFIINGVDAQLDLKPNSSSSGTSIVNVGRNFSSNNTDPNAVDVDFGSGTVLNNAVNINGNLTHTGSGFYQTFATTQAKGFVLKGGTSTTPSTISYSDSNSDFTSYVVDNGAYVKLLTDLTLGDSSNTLTPVSVFSVNNLGTIDFNDRSIIGHNRPRFITAAGATLITSNSAGFGGTTATGSLMSFGSTNTTSANGAAQFVAGINYTFNSSTTTPFPTGTFGSPASLTFNNANVTSNRTTALTVSGAVNVNGTSVVALNSSGTNNLVLGGVMTIDLNATFDNNGENQITNGGGSIVINGTFITKDAQGFTGTNMAIPGITPTLGANSTIVFGKTGDQDVTNFTPGYKNITFAGSGIKTVTGTGYSISETITINNGVTLDAKSVGFGRVGTKLTMLGNSLFKTGGSGSKPDASGPYTLDPTSTIEFQGTSATEIAVSKLYEKIIVSGNNVKPSGLNLTVNQNTTVTPTGKLTPPSTNDSASSTVFNAKKGIVVQTLAPNSGSVIFQNNAQLMQDSDAVNSGSISMEREATIPVSTFNQYAYWSSPVIGQDFKNIFPGNPTSALYHNESNNKFYTSTGAYIPGRGLAVRNPFIASGAADIKTASLSGTPYNADLSYNLNFTDAQHGYNLVGNPYPSNLNLNQLYLNSSNIASTFLFWDNTSNTEQTQLGNSYTGDSYAKFNALAGDTGTGIPAPGKGAPASNNSKTPNNILKVGQGFMVRAKSSGAAVAFRNTDRITTQTSAQFFGKGGKELVNNRYVVEFVTPRSLVFSNAVVYFENGNNIYAVDDSKLESAVSEGLFTQAEDEKVVINGRSSFVNTDLVKLGTRQFTSGLYSIRLGTKEGIFANGQNIYLKDKQTGIVTNLSEGNYTFTANAGESTGRFEIIYQPETVLATDTKVKENLIVYKDGNDFVVKAQNKKISSLEVFDSAGRLIWALKPESIKAIIPAEKINNGLYVLKINQNGEITSKKIIR